MNYIDNQKKKILVIGGTGTMGRPLVNALYDKGYDLSVICRKKVEDARNSIKYYYGNAKDIDFIADILKENNYDVIVDFCWYTSREFAANHKILLKHTNQYVCLSSAAVYSDVPIPKDELSPRYLEKDPPQEGTAKYTWYCYEKARIEDLLTHSNYKNWTIVRPGTTMNYNHFGWGHDWNADWALRIMQGKKVIIPTDMLQYKFSLSSGSHVMLMLLAIIDNKKAIGEIFNVNSPEVYSWEDLLRLYRELFRKYGYEIKTKEVLSTDLIKLNPALDYWYKRARLLDRVFDSSKIYDLIDVSKLPLMRDLLEKWISDYITSNNKMKIADAALWHTAWMDRITKDTTSPKYFNSTQSYLKYLVMRYTPRLWNYLFYRKNTQKKR